MLIPRNKMTLRRIGEVALRDKNWNGPGFINKSGKKIEETSVPRNMIININNSGTGFIIQKLQHPIYIETSRLYAVALFVTAAHVVLDIVKASNIQLNKYPCKLDGLNEQLWCLLYKSYHSKYQDDAIGEIGASYCAGEGDFALMILLTPNPIVPINQMSILTAFIEMNGNDCLIAGYPSGYDSNPLYNYPYTNDEQTAINNLTEIFRNPKLLICSPGKIKYSRSIVEVTASSSSGMSGSPVISGDIIIGVFVGGPSLKGQRELYKAAKELYSNNVKSSWNYFEEYLKYKDLYENDYDNIMWHYSSIFKSLSIDIPPGLAATSVTVDFETVKHGLVNILIDEISELIKTIKNKEEISHNSALPTYSPAFRNLLEDAQSFYDFYSTVSQIQAYPILL